MDIIHGYYPWILSKPCPGMNEHPIARVTVLLPPFEKFRRDLQFWRGPSLDLYGLKAVYKGSKVRLYCTLCQLLWSIRCFKT